MEIFMQNRKTLNNGLNEEEKHMENKDNNEDNDNIQEKINKEIESIVLESESDSPSG